MDPSRTALWIALSELWLDTELDEGDLLRIAGVVRASGLSPRELDRVFELELAPFLGRNSHLSAGVWSGFDPEWVCAEARRRHERPRWWDRVLARVGSSTSAAREDWARVKALASSGESKGSP